MFIHDLHPVALKIGFVEIYWYGLMWALAFLTISTLFIKVSPLSQKQSDNLICFLSLGVILGAKLGYIFFYMPVAMWPTTLFSREGLSFHGGLLGFVSVLYFWTQYYKQSFLNLADKFALVFPWGLFWGRLGNFLNSELWGHPTEIWWAVLFKRTDPLSLPRHPSQLYEAFGEGILLGCLLYFFSYRLKKRGQLSSLFLIFYGVIRFMIEFFRVPDRQIMYKLGFTQGQWLCFVMIISGVLMFQWLKKQVSDT
jgi:phosphatidylglycerol:prolipoprotein diacylglycerol transferase